jgi:hypothetical protein
MEGQMVLRPNRAFPIAVWISIFIAGQFPLACIAQTPAKNQAQIRDIDQRLLALEKSKSSSPANGNLSDEQKAYLKNLEDLRTRFEALQGKMEHTAEHVSDTGLSISNSYFQMLALVVALAAVAVVIVGLVVEKIVSSRVFRKAKNEVDKIAARAGEKITERGKFETQLGRAGTFALLAYSWYEHYAPEFRRSLQLRQNPTVVNESGMARNLSERGIKILDEPGFVELAKDDSRAWIARATLTNLLVYNTTAYLLCQGAAAGPQEKADLLISTDTCLTLARDKRARDRHWYDLCQTAAFAMIKFGDPAMQAHGRALMLDLLNGKPLGAGFKAPEKEWRQELWDDCFSTTTTSTDLLGLGQIPTRLP